MTDQVNLSIAGAAKLPVPFPGPARTRDRWRDLRPAMPGLRRHILAGAPLVDFFRDDPAARAFDRLRTHLHLTLKEHGWRRIAIAAPTAGCGATFTTANLGLSFARMRHSRTVLLDLNLRAPGLADAFEICEPGGIRGFLAGETAAEGGFVRLSESLALGLGDVPSECAAELLMDKSCGFALSRMAETIRPDVVLFDLPPVLEHDDLLAFLPQVDAVLLVAAAGRTTPAQIADCERLLKGRAPLLGVVLNRAPDPRPGT